MVFQFTPWPLTLDYLWRPNRGNCVFKGLYRLNRACYDQSLHETHLVSHIWFFIWPHDIWPWITCKGQIDVIGYLMGCISWIWHVVIWICIHNEQIWLPGNYGSDFEQYLNRLQPRTHKTSYEFLLQLDPISLLVNFSHELAHILTTYQFLWAKEVILSNVWADCNLTQFHFWSTFYMNWHK